MRTPQLIAVASLLCLGLGTGVHAAALPFKSTSSPEAWKVTVHVSDIDNDVNQFLTTGFVDAKIISGRAPEGVNWIANNTSGNNANYRWTQFVFRQEFDLTGYVRRPPVFPFSGRLTIQARVLLVEVHGNRNIASMQGISSTEAGPLLTPTRWAW